MGGSLNERLIRTCLWACRSGGRPTPRVCVETGTYLGQSTRVLARLFSQVHTIELSPKYYEQARDGLADLPHVTCHLGDSGDLMGPILSTLDEPAMIFLDAHWAGGDTAHGKDEVPLLRELQAIAPRTHPDLIVIDDLRLIGKAGLSGSPGDTLYPQAAFDWRNINLEGIRALTGGGARNVWAYWRDRIFIFRRRGLWDGMALLVAATCLSLSYKGLVGARHLTRVFGKTRDRRSS